MNANIQGVLYVKQKDITGVLKGYLNPRYIEERRKKDIQKIIWTMFFFILVHEVRHFILSPKIYKLQ